MSTQGKDAAQRQEKLGPGSASQRLPRRVPHDTAWPFESLPDAFTPIDSKEGTLPSRQTNITMGASIGSMMKRCQASGLARKMEQEK